MSTYIIILLFVICSCPNFANKNPTMTRKSEVFVISTQLLEIIRYISSNIINENKLIAKDYNLEKL